MGLETFVPVAEPSLPDALARLADAGVTAMLVMIDGALVAPGAAPPAAWREARLRTPAGTVTVARRPGGVAVVVFGNADEGLRQAQAKVAAALAPDHPA
jgi:hypothetical protein